jgi:DNA-binding beta-propeller fold protein YncE
LDATSRIKALPGAADCTCCFFFKLFDISATQQIRVAEKVFMNKIAAVASFLALAVLPAISQVPLLPKETIELPGVTGKFDHFAIDLTDKRLFAAATGNHSVEIIDLVTGKVQQSIPGLGKPHGLAWIASSRTLYVADGSRGELQKYQGSPLALSGTLHLSDDADDLVYDESDHLLFVGHGGSDSANPARVAVVDTTNFELKTNIPVASHPEALDIDVAGRRIFVNIAASNEIAVLDTKTQKEKGPLAHWKLTKAADNVPLAFDAEHHVLYTACRTPSTLIAIDADSGKELSSIATVGGADDLFYDEALRRVYVIGGAGEVEAFQVDEHGSSLSPLHSLGTTHTAPGAKTALYVPSQSLLYVGIPSTEGQAAKIQVYATDANGVKR